MLTEEIGCIRRVKVMGGVKKERYQVKVVSFDYRRGYC